MNCYSRVATVALVALIAVLTFGQAAHAQFRQIPGMRKLFGTQPVLALALLEEVQKDVAFDDKMKEAVGPLYDDMYEERMAIFQDNQGDFEAIGEETVKLYVEMRKKLFESLSEQQQKRLVEIYIQANGPIVLTDEPIAAALELTKDQVERIQQTRRDQQGDAFGMFQDLQDMDDEEAAKEIADTVKQRDEELLAILTDQQRDAFGKMKGKEIKIDLDKLPGFGGRNR
jgi:hypothetical protein